MLVASWISQTGLPCCILKHDAMGHLCGYVGVPKNHSWYGKRYGDCILTTAKPRGERPEDFESALPGMPPISKMSFYHERITAELVCEQDGCEHRPETLIEVHGGITFSSYGYDPMPRDGEWWFGFDCAHAGDAFLGLLSMGGTYKEETYVRGECEKMAEQLVGVVAQKEGAK